MNAGESEKVFRYSIAAGDEAIQSYAYEDALVSSRRGPGVRSPTRPRPPSGTDCGRFWETQTVRPSERTPQSHIYRAAAEVAPDRAAFAAAFVGIGEAQNRAGAYRDARATFERALRETGCGSSSRFTDFCKSVICLTVPIGDSRQESGRGLEAEQGRRVPGHPAARVGHDDSK